MGRKYVWPPRSMSPSLDRMETARRQMAKPGLDRPRRLERGTVLVVDDHEGVRLVVDQILSDDGYVVLPADCEIRL